MSDGDEADKKSCCASCGITEVDDVKLVTCDGCDLVKYCSDECQKNHKLQHETACKKRAAELRDEILFKQPESTHLGDCPICFLPVGLTREHRKTTIYSCCGKVICNGCAFTEDMKNTPCPFCRQRLPKTMEAANKRLMKRVEANDPVALWQMGTICSIKKDYKGTFNYNKMAAELGDAEAHYDLSNMYQKGRGVEKDEKKKLYHLEEAAIRGHPNARYCLGFFEGRNGRYERVVKHWIIAATQGHDESLKGLKDCYRNGLVSKDDFAAALRSHQAAVNATKSPQREAAAKDEQRRREMELSMYDVDISNVGVW